MTGPTRLEHDLAAWLEDTAMPRTPDFVDDILDQTARIRQRPRWTFVGRWLPSRAVGFGAPVAGRVPWRTIGMLALLALLLAAVAAYVGSQPRLPAPFGLAANGLLASSRDGDIFLFDPVTRASRPLVTGPDVDHDPRWSLDGTRVAFLRTTGDRDRLVVTDLSGTVLAISDPFPGVDSDSVSWSPSGRSIALGAGTDVARLLFIIDATDGSSRGVPVDYIGAEVFWRPPDGGQLLINSGAGLQLVSVEGLVEGVPPEVVDPWWLRPLGWSPDGRAFLYQHDASGFAGLVHVVDVETGTDRQLDVIYGHVSNDGTRVAGARPGDQRLCVISIGGGPCRVVPGAPGVDGEFGAGIRWAPNDRWILIASEAATQVWLVDPDGDAPFVDVPGDGPASFQRKAP